MTRFYYRHVNEPTFAGGDDVWTHMETVVAYRINVSLQHPESQHRELMEVRDPALSTFKSIVGSLGRFPWGHAGPILAYAEEETEGERPGRSEDFDSPGIADTAESPPEGHLDLSGRFSLRIQVPSIGLDFSPCQAQASSAIRLTSGPSSIDVAAIFEVAHLSPIG